MNAFLVGHNLKSGRFCLHDTRYRACVSCLDIHIPHATVTVLDCGSLGNPAAVHEIVAPTQTSRQRLCRIRCRRRRENRGLE